MKAGRIENISTTDIMPEDNKDLRCAPTKTFKNGSCITLELLIAMANAYNSDNSNDKIPVFPEVATQDPVRYKKYLIKQLSQKLDKVCDTQRCWIDQPFVKKIEKNLQDDLRHYTFRPKGPKEMPDKDGNFEWLDTFDINDVMSQYEKLYTDYKFLGAVPLDFQKLSNSKIKDKDLDALLQQQKSKIGIIYNLDYHNEPGSHWVAGF